MPFQVEEMDVQKEEEVPSGRMATGQETPGMGSAEPEYVCQRPEPPQDAAFHAAAALLVPEPMGDEDPRYPMHPKVRAYREWKRRNPEGTRRQWEEVSATDEDIRVMKLMQQRDEERMWAAKAEGKPFSQEVWDFTF